MQILIHGINHFFLGTDFYFGTLVLVVRSYRMTRRVFLFDLLSLPDEPFLELIALTELSSILFFCFLSYLLIELILSLASFVFSSFFKMGSPEYGETILFFFGPIFMSPQGESYRFYYFGALSILLRLCFLLFTMDLLLTELANLFYFFLKLLRTSPYY